MTECYSVISYHIMYSMWFTNRAKPKLSDSPCFETKESCMSGSVTFFTSLIWSLYLSALWDLFFPLSHTTVSQKFSSVFDCFLSVDVPPFHITKRCSDDAVAIQQIYKEKRKKKKKSLCVNIHNVCISTIHKAKIKMQTKPKNKNETDQRWTRSISANLLFFMSGYLQSDVYQNKVVKKEIKIYT